MTTDFDKILRGALKEAFDYHVWAVGVSSPSWKGSQLFMVYHDTYPDLTGITTCCGAISIAESSENNVLVHNRAGEKVLEVNLADPDSVDIIIETVRDLRK